MGIVSVILGLGAAAVVGGGVSRETHTAIGAPKNTSHAHLNDWEGFTGPTTTVPVTTTEQPTVPKHTVPPRASRSIQGSGACGGSLPPCCVLKGESGGNLTAHNPSGADGKWQFMPGTWTGVDGNKKDGGYRASDGNVYSSPSSSPEWVQDEAARHLYAGGANSGQWSAQC